MKLRLELLGRLRVTDTAGTPVSGLRPRARRLLAYLLLHRQRAVPRQSVAFALWPDSPEDEARGALRRALNDLRAALPALDGAGWVRLDNAGLRWDPDAPCQLDVAEFERLLEQATPAALHGAVALYTGDLLADWDDEWLWGERERLRQLQLGALRQLVAHHRALGEHVAALGLARQALALDPLAEAVHRELITLHYQAGDRAAALAAYERLRTLLRDELGVEPMPETQELRRAITRGGLPATDLVSTRSSDEPAPETGAAPTIIGRGPEMAQLTALWDAAAAGRGGLAIVGGEAGVGKSHLALGLADYATRRRGLALIGHCDDFEQALPYQAIVEMLRSAADRLRHSDLPPAHRVALARLVPDVLGATAGPATEAGISPDDLRAQLFEALLQAFLALARSQPALLLIEDVQWAAESTLDWLTYITPRLATSRLLVAITHRTEDIGAEHALARLRRRLAHEKTGATLSLRPLSREAHQELVSQLSGLPHEAVGPIADRLYQETAGNPFFLQEIGRGLLETGQLIVDNGRWQGPFIAAAPGSDIPLPASLRTTVKARLQRLPEQSRSFIQVAAAAGRVFPYEVIRRAGNWDDEAALAAVEDLLARGFLRQHEGQDDLAFTHHLVQEAIYADLMTPRRGSWHRRLAEVLQTLRPDDVGALAYHFARGGQPEKAIDYALQAAQRAEALFAYDEAIRHLRTALDQIAEGTRPEQRLAVLEQLADVYRLKREVTQAIPLYQAALDLWNSLAYASTAIAVRLQRKMLQMLPDVREGVGFARFEAAAQAGTASRASLEASLGPILGGTPHPETVRLLIALSGDAWKTRFPADKAAAEHYARAAVEMAEALDAPVELSAALEALGDAYGLRGHFREKRAVALRRLALSRDQGFGDRRERISALLSAGKALAQVGEYAEALPQLREAEHLSDRIQAVNRQYQALEEQARCLFRLDRWEDVLALEPKWRAIQRHIARERFGPVCFSIAMLAGVHALRGEFDRATSLREEAYALMTTVSGPPERWKRSHHY